MLNDYGAVGVAKKLIKASDPQSGFRRLINEKRMDLTMEKIMLEAVYQWGQVLQNIPMGSGLAK